MKVRRAEYGELAALFFIQMMAWGMWLVPLSSVLQAHGLSQLRAYAYATSAVAAFISPLLFGAMADRHVSPVRLLRWLSVASASTMALASWSIGQGWPAGTVLALIQVYAICAAPTGSLISTIIFSRLDNSQRQFGPVRAGATLGWMCGCWVVSGLNADTSPLAGYSGAAVWLGLAAFTYLLAGMAPAMAPGPVSFRERMGWDALSLLKNHDHRVVFITVALCSIPIAAFYPYTPPHLQHLGFQHTSAWMSLGQVSELMAMFALGGLISRWRLKWILAGGLAFAVARFALCALNARGGLLGGVALHGVSFTLIFITAQIYLNERVDTAWRARAQALMSLMTSGVGNLAGYLGTGFWFRTCEQPGGMRWPLFWSGLSLAMAAVALYFLSAYHGQGTGLKRAKEVVPKAELVPEA